MGALIFECAQPKWYHSPHDALSNWFVDIQALLSLTVVASILKMRAFLSSPTLAGARRCKYMGRLFPLYVHTPSALACQRFATVHVSLFFSGTT